MGNRDLEFHNLARGATEGVFTRHELPSVLMRVVRQGRTGRLTLTDGPRVRTVGFSGGLPTLAGSQVPAEHFGERLMKLNLITPDDRSRVDALMRREPVQFGAAMVRLGLMTTSELRRMLTTHHSWIIAQALGAEEVSCSFVPFASVARDPTSLTLLQAVEDAVRQYSRAEREALWSRADGWRFGAGDEELALAHRLGCSRSVASLIERARGGWRTLGQLALACQDADAQIVVLSLAVAGLWRAEPAPGLGAEEADEPMRPMRSSSSDEVPGHPAARPEDPGRPVRRSASGEVPVARRTSASREAPAARPAPVSREVPHARSSRGSGEVPVPQRTRTGASGETPAARARNVSGSGEVAARPARTGASGEVQARGGREVPRSASSGAVAGAPRAPDPRAEPSWLEADAAASEPPRQPSRSGWRPPEQPPTVVFSPDDLARSGRRVAVDAPGASAGKRGLLYVGVAATALVVAGAVLLLAPRRTPVLDEHEPALVASPPPGMAVVDTARSPAAGEASPGSASGSAPVSGAESTAAPALTAAPGPAPAPPPLAPAADKHRRPPSEAAAPAPVAPVATAPAAPPPALDLDAALRQCRQSSQGDDARRAVLDCQAVLAQDPRNALAYRLIGMAYVKLNAKPRACEALRRYLRFAPDAPDRAEVERWLLVCD